MKFIVAEKKTENGLLLVITDESIIGKKFEEKNLQLDLSKKFYEGKSLDLEQLKEIVKKAYILHLSGENSVNFAVKLGLVDPEKILIVQNVKHAQVLLEFS